MTKYLLSKYNFKTPWGGGGNGSSEAMTVLWVGCRKSFPKHCNEAGLEKITETLRKSLMVHRSTEILDRRRGAPPPFPNSIQPGANL